MPFDDVISASIGRLTRDAKANKLPEHVKESLKVLDPFADGMHVSTVPMQPCLPLEAMLNCSGLPLHTVFAMQGPTYSTKSSMFWFFARQWLAAGGYVIYLDCENKYDVGVAMAYVGNPIAFANRVRVIPVPCTEALVTLMATLPKDLQSDPIISSSPILLGIDSLGATNLAAYAAKAQSQDTSTEFKPANSTLQTQEGLKVLINMYLRTLPMSLYVVQQERREMETQRIYASGGTFSGYTRSMALRMNRRTTDSRQGLLFPVIDLEQAKISAGTQRDLKIELRTTRMLTPWKFQAYVYTWNISLLKMLASLPVTDLQDMIRVKQETDLKYVITHHPKYRGTYAGLDELNAIGRQIHDDPEIVSFVRDLLNVRTGHSVALPGTVPPAHDWPLWLSPLECPEAASMTYDQVDAFHKEFYLAEMEKARQTVEASNNAIHQKREAALEEIRKKEEKEAKAAERAKKKAAKADAGTESVSEAITVPELPVLNG